MTSLGDVVDASRQVTAARSRSQKVAILARLLRQLEPDEVPIAVAFLSGVPRQGRIGIGYSTLRALAPAPVGGARLDLVEVDRAIDQIVALAGGGSASRRRQRLEALLGRATPEEIEFVRRLLMGELRQGALAGIMADAIASAAEVPSALVRRALMLSGNLSRTAEIALATGEEGLRAVGFEVFRPILPMLASTASNVAEAVHGFDCASVEWKLDGIRVQIHRRGARSGSSRAT